MIPGQAARSWPWLAAELGTMQADKSKGLLQEEARGSWSFLALPNGMAKKEELVI
jgi:hypothetical protein